MAALKKTNSTPRSKAKAKTKTKTKLKVSSAAGVGAKARVKSSKPSRSLKASVNALSKRKAVKAATAKMGSSTAQRNQVPAKATSKASALRPKSFKSFSVPSGLATQSASTGSVLEIKAISKVYRKRKVVNEVSFQVNQGEVVGLLGPNGAGKTTSFYITVGLIKPNAGQVFFDKKRITAYPMYRRARIGIGYLPQEPSVFRKLTVLDNVLAILEARGQRGRAAQERALEILEQFKVRQVKNQYGYTLSGGERRRVEIARALAAEPKILLLDEPFAGVDPIAVKDIQNIIQEIKALNIGVLITDHNVRETLKIVSRAYIMNQGQVLIQGTAEQLISSKAARELYLGEDFAL